MNWTQLWLSLFHRQELLGLNMGFWVSMAIVALIVVIMNLVFWNMSEKKNE